MKKFICAILFICMMSCARYQVVQELRVNMYHLYSPKKGAAVVFTKDTLVVGKWYNLSSIKTIDTEQP